MCTECICILVSIDTFVRPPVDTWLTSWSTLDRYLDWYLVDTSRPTFNQHPNWHLISSVLIVGWVLTTSHVDWYLMVCLQKLVDSWLNIGWNLDRVLSKYRSIIDVYGVFIKCWSKYRSSVNWDVDSVSLINQHLSTHDPNKLKLNFGVTHRVHIL